jgi:phosphopantothenoylcysteine decarboxylase/phosphopantothenate--cysteine ligase
VSSLAGRTVALCVTGSVAAYKAVLVARLLVKAGATVVPVLTSSATRFVGPITFTGITGEPALTDMWDPSFSGEMHVAIAARADVIAIVPATADVIARLAQGRADDLVTATALCARGGVIAAPAMHPRMWEHPATQKNVDELARQKRVTLVGPVRGEVASGEMGLGRMADPETIVLAIEHALAPKDLEGKRIVVTAGPTHEAIDPVRFLGNRSSGAMGFAIAARAAARGAAVVLVAGPVSLPTPPGVSRRDVESAEEMKRATEIALGDDLTHADALVMAAAVADFRPLVRSGAKIKKGQVAEALELAENPDIVGEIGSRRTTSSPVLVAFALETGDDDDVIAYAKQKLVSKRVDLIVANAAHESLGKATNRVALVGKAATDPFVLADKETIADLLLDRLAKMLAHGSLSPPSSTTSV